MGSAAAAACVVAVGTAALVVYAYPEFFTGVRRGTLSMALAGLLERHAKRRRARRPIRVYMDGCFDLTHFGHANALRQAKACGDELVVGLVPDREILRCKGPPVLKEAERRAVVESFRWVDQMLFDVPYDIHEEFMNELYTKHRIDYIVHDDDPCTLPDGTDAYDAPKKAGKFKMIKRTEGVSTTDIVGRMLVAGARDGGDGGGGKGGKGSIGRIGGGGGGSVREGGVAHFCTTSRRVMQFSDGGGAAPPPAGTGTRVVYVHGAFDMFHSGHVHLLRAARQLGDFLVVGVHDDAAVRGRRGAHHPILNVQERSLGVMACRHVDEVIIGAPAAVTRDLVTTFNVTVVAAEAEERDESEGSGDGTKGVGEGEGDGDAALEESYREVRVSPVTGEVSERDTVCRDGVGDGDGNGDGREDPNAVAKEMGIFREVSVPGDEPAAQLSTAAIIRRIAENRLAYEARNAKKGASEANYYHQKATGAIQLGNL